MLLAIWGGGVGLSESEMKFEITILSQGFTVQHVHTQDTLKRNVVSAMDN